MKNLQLLENSSRINVAILAVVAFVFGITFKVEGLPFGRDTGSVT